MNVKYYINRSAWLKSLAIWALSPKGQSKPRFWVKHLVNPLRSKKGKKVWISKRTRMDLMPYNKFEIGNYSTIEDFSTVNNAVGHVIIGMQTRIGIGSTLIGPVHIGDDVRLAQNVVVSGLNHNYEDVNTPISKQGVTTKNVQIDNGSWIGANSVILPGTSIGKNSVVAAGSVVTKDVPPFSVVAGNPAHILKKFNQETQMWEKIS